jgi:NTP pyrophosphatase (non-canonical NTP hydrolase)
MDLKTYTEKAHRTMAELDYSLFDNLHMLMGMMTEVGELVDAYKKYLVYNKPLDMINVQEEIGDLMWYVANFCRLNCFDLEEILGNNIKKLEQRYPEKFTTEDATNRDLSAERKVLEELGYKQATFISNVESVE